jgi:hypothetical protein
MIMVLFKDKRISGKRQPIKLKDAKIIKRKLIDKRTWQVGQLLWGRQEL